MEIFNYQRPFAQTDDIEKMVGKCGIFPNESRAPVHSINFEIFRFFNFLQNNIKVFNTKTGELRPLNQSELDKIYDHIFSHSSNISYYHIRKWAEIPEEYSFRDVDASKEKEKIKGLKPLSGYHKLRKAIKDRNGDLWEKITNDFNLYEQIVYGLTVRKTDEDLKDYFEGISQLSPQEVETLVNYGPNLSGFANLSVKAYKELAQIIRKEGENYTHAEEILRSKYPNETLKLKRNFTKLPPFTSSSVTNPVVKKVISQTRKVINAIVDKYGSPSFVNIELARDLAKSEDEKRKITKNLEEITKGKEKIKKFLEENFDYFKTKEVTPHDILKYELREEQLGKCLLSGKEIPAEKLFEDNYVEIDHALPYSRSFDDSRNNKILVLTSVNRKKGNSTPFEYFGGDENSEQWQNFVNFVNSLNINTSKKNKILNTTLPKDVPPEEFLNRNLNDTQFAARTIKNYVENNLKFRETPGKKRKVYVITGAMTNYLLKMYGLPKNRDLNARHHAVDATLVGITTPWMIQKMNEWHKNDKENFYKRKKSFPNPWPNFRNDVLIRVFGTQKPQKMDSKEQNGEINSEFWKYKKSDDFLKLYKDIKNKIKPLIVSREPKRKIRGAAHLETVYSQRGVTEKGLSILGTRKQIDLSKESKDLNNSLEKIYKNTDPAYYKAVNKAINEKRKLEPDEPLTWKDPNKKSPIFSYISETVENNTVKLKRGNGYGYVLNSRIVRTDVFKKDGKYYLVPIYLPEIMSGELPNKVITINTPKSDWQELDDTYEFQFSLYKNDFIKIKVKKDDDYYLSGYFIGVDSSNARISFVKHDNVGSKGYIRKGSKNLYLIEKYQVDVLGRLYKVHKETRQPIILK
ncbi:MAG: hypothetical protein KatS3mg085_268 [Candidatus Dojkabacteria bacterium]|nr:MAG: hypothetical protein KatS3mg085_268 [Candidatus Dojkabacteria bacterium]